MNEENVNMMLSANLLLAIFRQAINDYMKLDPDSDRVSADYVGTEGETYQTAEDFIFNGVPLEYGNMDLTFDDCCEIFKKVLPYTPKQLKRKITENSIEY